MADMAKRIVTCIAAVFLFLNGCTATSEPDRARDDRQITVFAAASLTQVFTELGERFEEAHPGTSVDFSFAGSSDLVAQLEAGAPADVFASADENNMTKALDAGLMAGDPVPFVTNQLIIVTEPGNPFEISSLEDLTISGLKLVTCAPQVPCGNATVHVANLAGVDLTPVSEENSVTSVLAKVTSGEADAGLVYVTDAIRAGDQVEAIDFDEASQVTNVYPIGVLESSSAPETAQAFVDFVLSDDGQSVLTEAGFNSPGD